MAITLGLTYLLGLFMELLVKLIQCLNVVARKRNRDRDDILVALLGPTLYGVTRLGPEPGSRSDLALPSDTVRVAPTELVHNP